MYAEIICPKNPTLAHRLGVPTAGDIYYVIAPCSSAIHETTLYCIIYGVLPRVDGTSVDIYCIPCDTFKCL